MSLSLPRKANRKPVDKLTELRRYKWTPSTPCPNCGAPMYTTSSLPKVRKLKCRECGTTGKQYR